MSREPQDNMMPPSRSSVTLRRNGNGTTAVSVTVCADGDTADDLVAARRRALAELALAIRDADATVERLDAERKAAEVERRSEAARADREATYGPIIDALRARDPNRDGRIVYFAELVELVDPAPAPRRSERALKRALADLLAAGCVQQMGTGRNTAYRLTPKVSDDGR